MLNQQQIKGNWNEIKGKVRERWGQLTDDELTRAKGDAEQLVGLIQRKTGEAREAIEGFLDELAASDSPLHQATETVSRYAQQAAHAVQEGSQQAVEQANEQLHATYVQTQRLVRTRPVESLAVCFGVGLITGVVVAISMRGR